MLLSVAPSERFHSLDGSTFQKVGNILTTLKERATEKLRFIGVNIRNISQTRCLTFALMRGGSV